MCYSVFPCCPTRSVKVTGRGIFVIRATPREGYPGMGPLGQLKGIEASVTR